MLGLKALVYGFYFPFFSIVHHASLLLTCQRGQLWEVFVTAFVYNINSLIFNFFILFTCACACESQKGGVGSPGAGVTDGCEPPCRYWNVNLGPLKDQQLLLTTETSVWPPVLILSAGVSGNRRLYGIVSQVETVSCCGQLCKSTCETAW